jgi:hypothetical protein
MGVYGRWSAEAAEERHDAELVALADAAVVVWDGCEPVVARLLASVERKDIRFTFSARY